MWYIFTTEYYSTIKKNGVTPFAAIWMDLEIITLSEESQAEKDKCHMILLRFRVLKKIQMNLFTKQKQNHRLRD